MFLRNASLLVLLSTALTPVACSSSEAPQEGPSSPADAGDSARADARIAEAGASAARDASEPADANALPDGSHDPAEASDSSALQDASDASESRDASEASASQDANDSSASPDSRDASMVGDIGSIDAQDGELTDASDGSEAQADGPDAVAPGDPSEVAYVSTHLGGILGLSVDPTSGALAPVQGSPFGAGAGYYALGVAPAARFVYAADWFKSNVDGYRIMRDGSLAPLLGFPVKTGGQPIALSIDPQERFVIVGNFGEKNIYVYSFDRATGGLNAVANSPFAIGDTPAVLAVDPSSRFLYVSSNSAAGIRGFAIGDPSGQLVEMQGSPFGVATVHGGGFAFAPTGRLLYSGGSGISGFRYDAVTGVLTDIPGAPLGPAESDSTAVDIATDVSGQHVYAVSMGAQTLSAYTVEPTTGALTALPGSPYAVAPSPYSVGVDPSGRFIYVGNDAVQVTGLKPSVGDGGLLPLTGSPFPFGGPQPEFAFVRFDP
jgi:6-phosphogluconolactonase